MFISGSPISDYDDMSAPVDWTADTNQRKRGPWSNSNSKAHTSLWCLETNQQVSNCRGAQKSCLQSRNFMDPETPIPRPRAHALISTHPFGPSNEESCVACSLGDLSEAFNPLLMSMPLLDTRQLQLSSPSLNVARETAEVGSRWRGHSFFCTSVVHTYRTYIVAKQGLGAHRKKAEMAPRSFDKQSRNLLEHHVAHSHLVGQDREKEQEVDATSAYDRGA